MSGNRIIFGFHAITSRLKQSPETIKEIYMDAARHDQRARDLMQLTQHQKKPIIGCPAAKLDSLAGCDRHQGVVAVIDAVQRMIDLDDLLDNLTEPARLLILDGVQDPHNLGACLRIADAFSIHAVIAPKDRAAGLNATVHKVSSGAADTVPFIAVTNLSRTLKDLKQRGIWIIGTAGDAQHTLDNFDITEPIAWVFGSEEKGLRRLTRENCDFMVRIPMSGQVESLNISVSVGICLFETHRQRMLRSPS